MLRLVIKIKVLVSAIAINARKIAYSREITVNGGESDVGKTVVIKFHEMRTINTEIALRATVYDFQRAFALLQIVRNRAVHIIFTHFSFELGIWIHTARADEPARNIEITVNKPATCFLPVYDEIEYIVTFDAKI
jgi:hypothetical protein